MLRQADISDKIQVYLPSWRNQVDIYLNDATKESFLATVCLNKVGLKKTWQRRLRHNYMSICIVRSKPIKLGLLMPRNTCE